ncbi:hypothetical protein DNTS_032910 [Danionella cerebrum]|uniref:Queuine tRNA-ribosyltransferase accessory subunit 2 n=1 Tax=Danionella cerebrum TaxID=2873325 RepID=A0A553MTD6_9TELE|nr:hypothetical protein DNTS_032910 [Danionella translucida]
MKLELSRVVQGCRLGKWTGLGKSAQHSLEVPGCLLYTRCATVPHLTQDTLHTIRDLPAVTQVSLDSLTTNLCLNDTVIFCSLHDSVKPRPAGYITNKTVSVWGSGGRMELTTARFMEIQAGIQPDCYQSMADGETWQANTSRKRVRKAVDRTLAHLDECLLLHQKTQELKHAEIFGVVEGGDVLEERLRSARETAKRPVGGFVLDGFHSAAMGPDVRAQLIQATSAELPQEKPRSKLHLNPSQVEIEQEARKSASETEAVSKAVGFWKRPQGSAVIVLGVGRPDEVISCVEAGVDLFESFFPFQVTERGCALSFPYAADPAPETSVPELNGESVTKLDGDETMTLFEMNLKDKRYKDDFRPLVQGCACFCCQKHTRAYVHHLLETNELLSGVLLMLHNTSHYLGFFRALREAIACDHLQDFKNRVLRHRKAD